MLRVFVWSGVFVLFVSPAWGLPQKETVSKNAARGESCLRLLTQISRHFQLAPPLLEPARQDLLEDVEHWAIRLQNPLIKKAWEKNADGVLLENPDFDFENFVAEQVRAGIDIDARDPWGRTALMHAAVTGARRLQSALLKSGARIDLRDFSTRSAAEFSMLFRTRPWVPSRLALVERDLSAHGSENASVWAAYFARPVNELNDVRQVIAALAETEADETALLRELEWLVALGMDVDAGLNTLPREIRRRQALGSFLEEKLGRQPARLTKVRAFFPQLEGN